MRVVRSRPHGVVTRAESGWNTGVEFGGIVRFFSRRARAGNKGSTVVIKVREGLGDRNGDSVGEGGTNNQEPCVGV